MRTILHVVGVRWWSAIAAYAVDLAEAQEEAGHIVAVAALRGSPADAEARRRGLEAVHPFTAGPRGMWRLGMRLMRFVRMSEPDVLHVHTGLGHVPAEMARWGADPAPALVRTWGEDRRPRSFLLRRWLWRRADALVFSGRFMSERVDGFGVDADRVTVLPGAVDAGRFHPERLRDPGQARRRLSLPGDGFIIGVAARLSPVKGHRVVVDALARLRHLDPPVHALFAGEEAQLSRDDLRAAARAGEVEARVHFAGREPDVRDIFSALDAGVVSSVGSEVICRVAGEMMACGLPLVASAVGVLPDMISDGETGLLVPAGDPDALADAVRRLHADAGLRRDLGRRARAYVASTLSSDRIARRSQDIYERALSRRGGS